MSNLCFPVEGNNPISAYSLAEHHWLTTSNITHPSVLNIMTLVQSLRAFPLLSPCTTTALSPNSVSLYKQLHSWLCTDCAAKTPACSCLLSRRATLVCLHGDHLCLRKEEGKRNTTTPQTLSLPIHSATALRVLIKKVLKEGLSLRHAQ